MGVKPRVSLWLRVWLSVVSPDVLRASIHPTVFYGRFTVDRYILCMVGCVKAASCLATCGLARRLTGEDISIDVSWLGHVELLHNKYVK